MQSTATQPVPRRARLLAWAVALLLAVRFSSSIALLDANLSPSTGAIVAAALVLYEIVLGGVLTVVFFVMLGWLQPPASFRTTIAVLALFGAALIVWLLAILYVAFPWMVSAFLVFGVASVASASWLAHGFTAPRRMAMRPWTRKAFVALLVILPVALALRASAIQGLDPFAGSAGNLRGNWVFVHAPTIALEFLVLIVFLNVLFDRSRAELRRRWYAFLPFLLVPLILDVVADRPLTGYILSAFVSWGANLTLFDPALVSLALVTAVLAAFASTLLLVGRRGNEESWDLLLLGATSAVFAGFYLSMASVAGLAVSMLMITRALASWRRPSS